MERKEKKLHKIHLKDYTNRLEKILENKSFSLQTKNLLLSMFYKIENAYHDYEKTKVEVHDKGEFLEKLIQIIEQKCQEIEMIKLGLEDTNMLETIPYTIDKEQGKIMLIGNDLVMLNAILEIAQNPICIPEEEILLQKPLSYFLNLGSRMHEAEVIRDFNGWSWDIVLKEIPYVELNLAFQNFLYLLGSEFISSWIKNDTSLADYLILAYEKLKNEFEEERAKELIQLFCKFSIEMLAKQDISQKEFWKNLKQQNSIELAKISDKTTYLEEVTQKKKEITREIEKIDKILNDQNLLQKEYQERNAKLANKDKIFSIRHLVNRLEIERQELVDNMKKYNSLIEPQGYVVRKDEIERKEEFYRKLNLEQEDQRESLLWLCLLFIECFQIKIARAHTKQEITSYFYILRYYYFLPFDTEGTKLKDIPKLADSFEKTFRILIEKAYKLDIIETITDDIEINYQIIRKLFDSKMIDLNNTVIETKVEDGRLIVQYYDTNILENTHEIQTGKMVKLKKKTKLFV